MIKIENTEVNGIARAVYAARNPLNSWSRSDSDLSTDVLGENDLDLAKRLAKAGPEHAKYRRMIVVYADITAPLYWWKEHDTYKVGTVANSCSTMHKIHSKPIEASDFSVDYFHFADDYNEMSTEDYLAYVVRACEEMRMMYLETGDKRYWRALIQLLPTSYNQRRTVMLNYEVLAAMYRQRKDHKLDEWREFCGWIKTLPYADELITMEGEKMEKTRAEDFFEKHPAAPKKDNIPVTCVKLCGYGEYTECDSSCKKCWDMPMDG